MPIDIDELERIGREDLEGTGEKLGLYPSRSKLGEIVEGLKVGFGDELPMRLAQAWRGGNVAPEEYGFGDELATRIIEKQKRDMQGNLPSREIMQGNEVNRSLYEGARQVPYSYGLGIGGMIAGGIPGAKLGAAAGSVLGLPGSAVGGVVGGAVGAAGASYLGMFNSAKDDFVSQIYDQVKDKVTPEQWAETHKAIESDANLMGHYEAGPEAFSSALDSLIIKLPISKLIPKSVMKNIVGRTVMSAAGKIAGIAATEVPTEVYTQKKQSEISAKHGMGEAQTYGEALKEVGGPTMVGAALGGAGMYAADRLTRGATGRGKQADTTKPDIDELERTGREAAAAEPDEYAKAVERATGRPAEQPFNVPMQGAPEDIQAEMRAKGRPQAQPFNVPMQDATQAQQRAVQRTQATNQGSPASPAGKRFAAKTPEQQETILRQQLAKIKELEEKIAPYENGLYGDLNEGEVEFLQNEKNHLAALKADLAEYQKIQAGTAFGGPQIQPFNIPMQPVPDRPAEARRANQDVLDAIDQLEALGRMQPQDEFMQDEKQMLREAQEREGAPVDRALARPQVPPFAVPMQQPDEAGAAQGRAMRRDAVAPFDVPMQPVQQAASPKEDDFESFKEKYVGAFNEWHKYKPDQAGFEYYANLMADMSDAHPDWVEQIEKEAEEKQYGKETEAPQTQTNQDVVGNLQGEQPGGRRAAGMGEEVVTGRGEQKQPWEMTLDEYLTADKAANPLIHSPAVQIYQHKNAVKKALDSGQAVPRRVLKDYPDLPAEPLQKPQQLPQAGGRAAGMGEEVAKGEEPKWHNFGAEKRKQFYDQEEIEKSGEISVWDFDENKWWKFKDKDRLNAFRDRYPEAFLSKPAGEERIWYRFGKPPEGNRSVNYQENKGENGVSVYATPKGSGGAAFFADRDIYSGPGRQVGWGSDGEPLIIPTGAWNKYVPTQSQPPTKQGPSTDQVGTKPQPKEPDAGVGAAKKESGAAKPPAKPTVSEKSQAKEPKAAVARESKIKPRGETKQDVTEKAKAEEPLTKKELALKEYQDFVGGLSDAERESVADLIIENPPSPGILTLRIKKALSSKEKQKEIGEAPKQTVKSEPATQQKKTAKRLRDLAAKLQNQIDAKRNPAVANQNLTARRANIISGMQQDADRLERVQTVMRGMADAIDNGTLPKILEPFKNRAQIEMVLNKSKFYRQSFHKTWLNDILDSVKGVKGIGKYKDSLERLKYDSDGNLIYLDYKSAVDSVEAALKLGRDFNGKGQVQGDLSEAKRYSVIGVSNQAQFDRVREALLKYAEPKSEETQKQKRLRELEHELIGTKIPGFFPTPKPVINKMLDLAEIESGDKVLEPSAGKGDIADALKEQGADLDVIEINHTLQKILQEKGYNLVATDFLEHDGSYDKIVMNPPFENGQDADHVRHAYGLLKPGGRLVSIMGEGVFFRSDKKAVAFREWFDGLGGTSEKLGSAFKGKEAFRQTGTVSRVVVLDKPASKKEKPETKLAVAHHGTPHIWPPEPGFPHGRPRLDKIFAKETVGEGAWAYGAGFYVAETPDVATQYAENLSDDNYRIDGLQVKDVGFYGHAVLDAAAEGRIEQEIEYYKEQYPQDWNDPKTPVGKVVDSLRGLKGKTVTRQTGNIYKLDIPDDVIPKLLDWDKPLSEQSEYVKKALAKDIKEAENNTKRFGKTVYTAHGTKIGVEIGRNGLNGKAFYSILSMKHGGKIQASKYLASIGVPGNKYLDGFSRGKGSGSYNFVIWDQKVLDRIALLERNGKKLNAIREAQLKVSPSKAEITPEKVQRRGIDVSNTKNVKRVVTAAGIIRHALRTTGLAELDDKISVELQAIIDLRNKSIGKSRKDWEAKGRGLSVILGATTFSIDELRAVVQVSLEQDLTSLEHTAFHEAFHIAVEWVLPDKQYNQLMISNNNNEETVADAWADFMMKRKMPVGPVRKIFNQLKRFFTAVGNALRSRGFYSQDQIFGNLAAGKYGIREDIKTGGATEIALSEKTFKPVDVKSKAFREWFGRSVVTKNGKAGGEPLVVYHGTDADFTVFDTSDKSLNFNLKNNLGENIGAFFSTKPSHAKEFGGKKIAVYLSLKKPMYFKTQDAFRDFMRKNSGVSPDTRDSEGFILEEGQFFNNTRAAIEKLWYDGVVIQNPQYSTAKDKAWFIAFAPTQIKSAEYNVGDFSKTNPDIRFKVKEPGTKLPAGSKPQQGEFEIKKIDPDEIEWAHDLQHRPSSKTIKEYKERRGETAQDPIIISEDNKVIDGAGRYGNARHLRRKQIDVIVVPFTFDEITNFANERYREPNALRMEIAKIVYERMGFEKRAQQIVDETDYSIDEDASELLFGVPETKLSVSKVNQATKNLLKDMEDMADSTIVKKVDDPMIKKFISTPMYWKLPVLQRLYKSAENSQTYFHGIVHDLTNDGAGGSMVDTIESLLKKNKAAYNGLRNYLMKRDQKNIGYRVRKEGDDWEVYNPAGKFHSRHADEGAAEFAMIEAEAKDYANSGASTEAVAALKAIRVMNIRAFHRFMQPMREMIRKARKKAEQQGYTVEKGADGKFFAKKDDKKVGKPYQSESEAWDSVMDLPQVVNYDKDGKKVEISWQAALAAMGDLRGSYMPRVRKPGRLAIRAWKEGKNPIREQFELGFISPSNKATKALNASLPIGRRFRELKRQGYKVQIERVDRTPEDVFDLVSPTFGALQIYNQAMGEIGAKDIQPVLKSIGLQGRWDTRKKPYKEYLINGEWLHESNVAAEQKRAGFYEKVRTVEPKGTDYIVTGDILKEGMADILEDLGAEYRFRVVKRGKETIGQPQWIFRNAPEGIENKIAQRVFEANAIAPDFDAAMIQAMAERISNVFKARGPRSHMIQRSTGKDVWEGYETDPLEAIKPYLRGLAAGEAKRQLATELFQVASGTDISWQDYKQQQEAGGNKADWNGYKAFVRERGLDAVNQQNAFRDGTSYIKDMLRNQEAPDRIFGWFTGAAVLKYLGFRVSAPIINMTVLPTAVPAAMHGLTKASGKPVPFAKGLRYLGKALRLYSQYRFGGKYGVPNLQDENIKKLFDEINRRGWAEPEYERESMATLKGKAGRRWQKFMDYAMLMFSVTEQMNRAASIAGTYLALHDGKVSAQIDNQALELGKKVSSRANAEYGKANRIYMARGTHGAAQVLKSFWVFKTFQHNYFLNMYHLGATEKDAKAVAWMLISPAILAGAGASAMTPIIKMLGQAFGWDDPEEEIYKGIQSAMGDDAETLARYGISGALFGVNIKGSLGVDIGVEAVPTTLWDLAGAPGSVVKDVTEGIGQLTRGNVAKGLEKIAPLAIANPIKGLREVDEGVTTRTNAPVFYGNEQLRGDWLTAAMRFLSLNPARLSGPREKQWAEIKTERKYTEKRTEIYQRIKKFYLQPPHKRSKAEWVEILEDIKIYNYKAKKKNLTLIKERGIKSNINRAFKPSKKERERAARMQEDE